tara:strand:+ start:75 stop:530 length:456 start_codon:yes stop_codon:yes gene_type:complete
MREKLNSELKHSIINKNLISVKTLRLILAAIKDRDIVARSSGNSSGIEEDEIISLLKKMIKQREESIVLYKKGNRLDLVKSEEDEIKIISNFLPEQLSVEEIKKIVSETVKSEGASSIKEMGKVITKLKENYPQNMDFAFASKILKEILLK